MNNTRREFWNQQIEHRKLILFACVAICVCFFFGPWYVVRTGTLGPPGAPSPSYTNETGFGMAITLFQIIGHGASSGQFILAILYLLLFFCPVAAGVLFWSAAVSPNALSRKKVATGSVVGLAPIGVFLGWHLFGDALAGTARGSLSPVIWIIEPVFLSVTIASFGVLLLAAATKLRQRSLILLMIGATLLCIVVLSVFPTG